MNPQRGLSNTQTASVELVVGGRPIQVKITVPKGPTRPSTLLPQLQALSNTFVSHAVKEVEQAGLQISCTKGCGACCRQVVPISCMEAQGLREVVRKMPPQRRSIIQGRFEAACHALEKAGLLERFLKPETIRDEEISGLGLKYFALGIACPFLEEESCSIHPDRPIACREYLVTSPAGNCANPQKGSIQCVPMPVKLSRAIRRLGDPQEAPWLPMILAFTQPEADRSKAPKQTGPQLVQTLISRIAGYKEPPGSLSLGAPAAKPWWRFW